MHHCGYDSVPHDLLALALARACRRRARGGGAARVTLCAGRVRGGASGGTLASVLGILELVWPSGRCVPDAARAREMLDPFQLARRAAAVPGAPSATDPAAAR